MALYAAHYNIMYADTLFWKICGGNRWDRLILHITTLAGYLKKHYSTLFHPPLPPHKVHSIQSLGFGTCNKVYVEFDVPWWDTDCEIIYLVWKDEVCGPPTTHHRHYGELSDWKIETDKHFCVFRRQLWTMWLTSNRAGLGRCQLSLCRNPLKGQQQWQLMQHT